MKRTISTLLAGLFVVLIAQGTALAQDEPQAAGQAEDSMRSKIFEDTEVGVRLERPSGWVSGKTPKGVVAVLRAAGDEESQIEIRMSPHVKAKQREFFFTSFHANLQQAGFVKKDVQEMSLGGKEGALTEYETSSKKRKFRLLVWQTHRKEAAWLVVGFFPAERREDYFGDYKQVIENIEFTK